MKQLVIVLAVLLIAGLAVGGYVFYNAWWNKNYHIVELTDYNPPSTQNEAQLADDTIDQKNPTFDAARVDSRPLGDWQVNASAAVIRLDSPMIKPDTEAEMLVLRPSYAAAIKAAKEQGLVPLPSAGVIDGAAKQFDDGLYAALDLACYRGELGIGPAAPQWVAAVFPLLPKKSPARPFLAAALELAGKKVELTAAEKTEKDRLLAEFQQDKAASKPIAFYDWTPELAQLWRFNRFLQHEFPADQLTVPRDIAAVLKANAKLLEQYRAICGFYGKLTNPSICLPVDALVDAKKSLLLLTKQYGALHQSAAVFPPSTSRETELFERVFPEGIAAGANLMAVLIARIRDGTVKLAPRKNDGWYQYQVDALETLLVPEKAQETGKLLLTADYKRRLIEAFKALVTKRRETHARLLALAQPATAPLGPNQVCPRLRLEPCATFYLRTARAYGFLQNLLATVAGPERLKKMHALRQSGPRELSLDAELTAIRQRFYGFYLITCEDIGMKPEFLGDEPVDQAAARQAALKWLDAMETDKDLACDTRAAVPIYVDPMQQKTRNWATLGVRLAHLEASYAQAPMVRPKSGGKEWKEPEKWQLGTSRYVLPVDEFAEIELSSNNVLSREELRAACDRYKTKEEIVRGLGER
jgi:hypothetical protein